MQKNFDGFLDFLMYSYLHLGFSKCKKGFWTTSPVWPQCCCISDLEWLMVNASNQDLLQATLKEQILNLILALCVLSCLSFDNGRCTQEATPWPWWWQHDHDWDNEKYVHDRIFIILILVTNIILILTIIIKLWKAGVSVWEPPTSWPSHTKLGNWGVNLWHRSSNQFE